MSNFEILIYDDVPAIETRMKQTLSSIFDDINIHRENGDEFKSLINLINRRRSFRSKTEDYSAWKEEHPADTADVIVVDYDLLDYSAESDATGARLAYLLRSFTRCGFIIVLNEYGENVFDMSPSGPTTGYGDLYIGIRQIINPGLWRSEFYGFRPWQWPIIPDARVNYELCVTDVEENLQVPILEFFGFSRISHWLPSHAWEFLNGPYDIAKVTFEEFAKHGYKGLAIKDLLPESQLARFAAARVVYFLNMIVLPEQSLLVDAPHLASRFPSLLINSEESIDIWNKLSLSDNHQIDDYFDSAIQGYRFKKQHWVWRPVWFWPHLNTDEGIQEVSNPWNFQPPDWVFCEDISLFIAQELSVPFRTESNPPFGERYCLGPNVPEHIIDKTGGPEDPREVQYVPEALFSSF